jgi:hypothetical protein
VGICLFHLTDPSERGIQILPWDASVFGGFHQFMASLLHRRANLGFRQQKGVNQGRKGHTPKPLRSWQRFKNPSEDDPEELLQDFLKSGCGKPNSRVS